MPSKKIIILISLLITASGLSAQSLLGVDDAVAIALKNNYDVSVARNNASVAKVNNTLGNAGMLPSISVTGSDNYSLNNVYMNLSSGSSITSSSASSNSLNAGAALNWTLFDGTKMFITKNKLTQVEKLGEIQFRDMVMQTIYNCLLYTSDAADE